MRRFSKQEMCAIGKVGEINELVDDAPREAVSVLGDVFTMQFDALVSSRVYMLYPLRLERASITTDHHNREEELSTAPGLLSAIQ